MPDLTAILARAEDVRDRAIADVHDETMTSYQRSAALRVVDRISVELAVIREAATRLDTLLEQPAA